MVTYFCDGYLGTCISLIGSCGFGSSVRFESLCKFDFEVKLVEHKFEFRLELGSSYICTLSCPRAG